MRRGRRLQSLLSRHGRIARFYRHRAASLCRSRLLDGRERRLFLMINPGAGSGSPSDQDMLGELAAFRDGILPLEELFRRQRQRFSEWGRNGNFLKLLCKLGGSLDDIALLNVAWCATAENKYPTRMLKACWSAHTLRALATLQPTQIVACGGPAHKFAASAGLPFVAAPHYAARKAIDFEALQTTLHQQA